MPLGRENVASETAPSAMPTGPANPSVTNVSTSPVRRIRVIVLAKKLA